MKVPASDAPYAPAVRDAWSLVRTPGQIDAETLFDAVRRLPSISDFDYRSEMLVHDALTVLGEHWGEAALRGRLGRCENRALLEGLREKEFDKFGFWTLRHRVVEATDPETILELFRVLGRAIMRPAQITVGGSSALILARLLVRQTEDIDVVNELPDVVRAEPRLIDDLAKRYELRLTHFASHYLPDRYELRTHSLGIYGRLDVRVVDSLDVIAGKMFSHRPKDFDDVRSVWRLIDRDALRSRLANATASFRKEPRFAESGEKNWYILTGEEQLPSE